MVIFIFVVSGVIGVSLEKVYKNPCDSPPPREDTVVVISLIVLRFYLTACE